MKALADIIGDLVHNQELHSKRLSDREIVVEVPTRHTLLKTAFRSQDDNDGYEHYTEVICDIPAQKRGEIAQAAISEPYRDITPVMPPGENRLLIYGSRTGLRDQLEREIRDLVLDDLGRIQGYDNEKKPVFNHILAQGPWWSR